MFPTAFLLMVLVAGGVIAAHVAAFTQLSTLRNRLALLEREREKDRELLEAVLLEDPGKLKRLLGTRD
jgi:hypothetical protein